MAKMHLKRFATPRTWKIKRKGIVFISRPDPGAHTKNLSIPINIVLKDMLKCARTTVEVKKLLNLNEVLVDWRRVKEHCFPVGLMDTIYIKPLGQHFRITFDGKGKLTAVSIDANEAKLKLCKIIGKTLLKGGKTQLNLSDSRNIIVEKDGYKVGDSVLIELPSQKISGQFKLEKGAAVLLVSGKHIAESGVVEKAGVNVVVYKNEKGEINTTSRKYAFVIGKEKPSIRIK